MNEFEITAPDGQKYRIQGDSQEGALRALQKYLGQAQAPQTSNAGAPAQSQGGVVAHPRNFSAQATMERVVNRSPESGVGVAGGASAAALDGFLAGAGDEYLAGLSAVAGLQPDGRGGANWFQYDKPIKERYATALDAIRQEQEAFSEERPIIATGAEIAGAVVGPGKAATGLNTAKSTGGATRNAALAGGAGGALAGFNEGEDGFSERAKGALFGAGTGAALGVGALLPQGFTRGLQRLVRKSDERPTVQNLEATKNALYRQIDNQGIKFSGEETQGILDRFNAALADSSFVEDVDAQTRGALRNIENLAGREISVSQLDKVRKRLWKRYNSSGDEVEILDAISSIDEAIDAKAGVNELFGAARAANRRYSNARLLENALEKAELQTASTGSGGNILNKYKQAVTSIITSPQKSRFFNAEELAVMEQFVRDDIGNDFMRKVGKLSPGGNGLISALSLYGAAIDPTTLLIAGTGAAAKGISDRGVTRRADQLLDMVSTGQAPEAARVTLPARAASSLGVVSQ